MKNRQRDDHSRFITRTKRVVKNSLIPIGSLEGEKRISMIHDPRPALPTLVNPRVFDPW